MKKLILLVTSVTLLSCPKANFGQAPNLGSTAGFALFTTVGAVTNSGISQVTGHVGSNSGSSTGFGNVNGVMNDQNGASALAATDLLTAYNQLNTAIPTSFPAPLLGNGQILTAKVYSISSAATLNGNLILDAQNNANAVFIFQISGSLSANAASKVLLINGAKACSVFWKVEGLVSMAAGAKMRGTLVANNAAITMAAGDTLEGRALSISGAIGINNLFAYTPIGCGSPTLTGPPSPTLASTECYAVFSGNGPVANSGITYATGDVGTNVGLATGFNTLNINGTFHPIPDGSTGTCATDLGLVYTYLNTLPYDIELLYPPQFGNNLVLTPHTYVLNGATMLTDTLYLNGLGNVNAVFVIKINGALTTSVNAKVKLINGTQAKNVFWKVDGAVSIWDNSVFKGTIVANNGAIDLKVGVNIDGRALTTNGALSTAGVTVTIPTAIGAASTISGLNTVCQGQTGVIYSVPAVTNATGYIWTLPAGATITGGANTNTITVSFNTASGNITVKGTNVCANGTVSANFAVTVNPLPLAAGTITGTNAVCQKQTGVIYSVPAVTNATGYIWTMPAGYTVTAGANTSIITVSFSSSALSGNITVKGNNGCGSGIVSANYAVTANSSPTVNAITSSSLICGPQFQQTATLTASGANTYTWSSGSNGSITAVSPSVTTTYTVNGTGANGCDNSFVITQSVSTCAGIDNFSEKATASDVNIYPNPFNANVNIKINEASQVNSAELKLYNYLGAEVMNTNINKQLTTLETNNLPSGMYFFKVISNNKVIQSGKLVSQQ